MDEIIAKATYDFGMYYIILYTYLDSLGYGLLLGIIGGLLIGVTLLVLARKFIFFKRPNKILQIVSKLNYLYVPIVFAIWGSGVGSLISIHKTSIRVIKEYTSFIAKNTHESSLEFQKYLNARQQYLNASFLSNGINIKGNKLSISHSLDHLMEDYVEAYLRKIQPESDSYFDEKIAMLLNRVSQMRKYYLVKSYVNSILAEEASDYTGLDIENEELFIEVDLFMEVDFTEVNQENIVQPFIQKLKDVVNSFFYGNYQSMVLRLLLVLLIPISEIVISKRLLRKETSS